MSVVTLIRGLFWRCVNLHNCFELCNNLSTVIYWDRSLFSGGVISLTAEVDGPVCFETLQRGSLAKLFIDILVSPRLRMAVCFPPHHLGRPVSLTHPPTTRLASAVHLSVAGSCGWAGLGCQWNIPEEKSPR